MMQRDGKKLEVRLTVNRPLKNGPLFAMLRTGSLTVTMPLRPSIKRHQAEAVAKREIVARLFDALDQLTAFHDPHGVRI